MLLTVLMSTHYQVYLATNNLWSMKHAQTHTHAHTCKHCTLHLLKIVTVYWLLCTPLYTTITCMYSWHYRWWSVYHSVVPIYCMLPVHLVPLWQLAIRNKTTKSNSCQPVTSMLPARQSDATYMYAYTCTNTILYTLELSFSKKDTHAGAKFRKI